jgi:hypothetical protein
VEELSINHVSNVLTLSGVLAVTRADYLTRIEVAVVLVGGPCLVWPCDIRAYGQRGGGDAFVVEKQSVADWTYFAVLCVDDNVPNEAAIVDPVVTW